MQSLGLALAVTDRDGLIASETFGHANLDAGTPVTRDVFRARLDRQDVHGRLAPAAPREGLVDLEEPVTRHLVVRGDLGARAVHAPPPAHAHERAHDRRRPELELALRRMGAARDRDRGSWQPLPLFERGLPRARLRRRGRDGEAVLGRGVAAHPGTARFRPPTPRSPTKAGLGWRSATSLYDDRPARRGDPWVPAAWLETGTGDGALAGTMEDLAAFVRALLNGGRAT